LRGGGAEIWGDPKGGDLGGKRTAIRGHKVGGGGRKRVASKSKQSKGWDPKKRHPKGGKSKERKKFRKNDNKKRPRLSKKKRKQNMKGVSNCIGVNLATELSQRGEASGERRTEKKLGEKKNQGRFKWGIRGGEGKAGRRLKQCEGGRRRLKGSLY